MRWAEIGLGQRLAFVTLLAGLITAAVGVTAIQVIERDHLIDEANQINHAAAERAALRIDDRITAFRTKVEMLAETHRLFDPELRPSSAAILLRLLAEADEVIIYEGSGDPVAAAASGALLDLDELPARTPPGSGPGGATTSWRGPAFEHVEVTVTIEDPPGTPVGLLEVRVPVALLAEEALAQPWTVAGDTMLTSHDGTLIVHPDAGRLVDGERYDLGPLEREGSYERGEGDERTLVAGVPLRSLSGWVLGEQSRSAVLEPATIAFGRFTWVFLAVITAMLLAILIGVRQMLRPLQALSEAVDRLRDGDHGTRITPVGTGEVGRLEAGFNRMVQDLEDRDRALRGSEREARAAVERLQLLIDGATDSAIFFVDSQGRIRSWNSGARRLLAYREEEILDQPLGRLVVVDDVEDPLTLVTGRNRVHLEGWCVRREGSRFRARLSLSALHEATVDQQLPAAPIGYAAVVNDLTDREIAQGSLRQALQREKSAADELRRAAEIKDEFLAIAAHELRTPLSAVLGSIGVLSDEAGVTPDQRQEIYDIITTAADDMHDIIEHLLDFSRVQTGRVRFVEEEFDLQEAIERHLGALRHDLEEHEVVTDVVDTTVTTDPDVLRHIVTNLVTNAAKFAPPATTIRVEAALEGDTLTVTVSDEGPGIPAQDHDRIFQLFRRSSQRDTAAHGTGVGLAIVQRYVDLIGGEIRLRSSPGEGATFTVRIPTARGSAGADGRTDTTTSVEPSVADGARRS